MFKLTIEEYVISTMISHGFTLNSHLRIKPNLLTFFWITWYVNADCLYRNALLTFACPLGSVVFENIFHRNDKNYRILSHYI